MTNQRKTRTELSESRRDLPVNDVGTGAGVVRFDANRRPVATVAEVAEARWQTADEKLDLALQDTFPASDPFSLQ